MRQDGRLSRMLHVLLHMEQSSEPMTSDKIALMLKTNPVVVRRTLGSLQKSGYVESVKGHGGGWTLVSPLSEISLFDVYQALDEPELFALGLAADSPKCLVEAAVNANVSGTLTQAEDLILDQFKSLKLSQIAEQVKIASQKQNQSCPPPQRSV